MAGKAGQTAHREKCSCAAKIQSRASCLLVILLPHGCKKLSSRTRLHLP